MVVLSKTKSNLCNHCHQRPKYSEPDGSRTHPYCGKTCAARAKSSGGTTSSNGTISPGSGSSSNCEFCHVRPKRRDGVKTHAYCSRSCANSAKFQSSTSTCQAPGCSKPVHANSLIAKYCSLDCKSSLKENACLVCLRVQRMADSHFCSRTCKDRIDSQAPRILKVPQGHSTFNSVADQFKQSWRHSTACPPIRHVYKVIGTRASNAAYFMYRDSVEARGQFAASGRSPGNENRRWHGTSRECTVGDNGQTRFCSSTSCSLCCILKSSYDISFFATKTHWGRFGQGIYTSSTSSKSNDYSKNAASCSSPLKAMILNKVVVGEGKKLLHDSTSLKSPPEGYDSVLAETGGSLNYDELVVYTNDAIRPSYLVMYEP